MENIACDREGSGAATPSPVGSEDTAPARAPGSLQLLGGARWIDGAGQYVVLERKAAALLALAMPCAGVSRARAAHMLWPESADPAARSNLRVLIHRLHRTVGRTLLAPGETLRWDASLAVDVNVADEQLLSRCVQRGPSACRLLGEYEFDDLDELGAWLAAARSRLELRLFAAHEHRLAQSEAAGDLRDAIVLAESMTQMFPLSERPYRELMRLHAVRGDRAAGLAAYERCRTLLSDQLGVSPSPQTIDVHRGLLQLQPAPSDAEHGSAGAWHTLPLVEREEPLARLDAAWQHRRPVLLRGECGIGKTRVLQAFLQGRKGWSTALSATDRERRYAALARILHDAGQRVRKLPGSGYSAAADAVVDAMDTADAPLPLGREQALQQALRGWLQCLQALGTTVLAVDDVHHADDATLALLGWLLESQAAAPPGICVVLTYRNGELAPGACRLYERLMAGGRADCIELKGLSLIGTAQLLAAAPLSASRLPGQAGQLYRLTAGNPRFVLELMRAAAQSVSREFDGGRAGVRTMLRSRLRCCSSQAASLARLAAMAGQAFSAGLAAAVLKVSPVELAQPWGELQHIGIFDEQGLAHELAAEAVRETVPDALSRLLEVEIAAHAAGTTARGTGQGGDVPQSSTPERWCVRAGMRAPDRPWDIERSLYESGVQ